MSARMIDLMLVDSVGIVYNILMVNPKPIVPGRRGPMEIKKTQNEKLLTIALEGRLDTTTAPELEAVLKDSLEGTEELVFDFSGLEYISSAGLRVLLAAQKTMNNQGTMKVQGVSEVVNEVFEVTGFTDILTIE